jgi:hypothetical protein
MSSFSPHLLVSTGRHTVVSHFGSVEGRAEAIWSCSYELASSLVSLGARIFLQTYAF